jgi:hypothetical protein
MLERNVEVAKHAPCRHEGDDSVYVRVRINIVQPHPHAELAERARFRVGR